MVSSLFVTDAEFNTYINESYQELYDLIIQAYGADYCVTLSSAFTTDGTNSTYALATDFYKLLGVDLQIVNSPNGYVTLKPFNFADRNQFSQPNFQAILGITNLRYRLQGSNLWLMPLPAAGQTLRYYYIPRLTLLSGDSDPIDVMGWERYIVTDGARKALEKEESDTSALVMEKQAIRAELENIIQNRDAGMPATVVDTQASGGSGTVGGFGGGFGGPYW